MDRPAEEHGPAEDAVLLDRVVRRDPAALRAVYERHAALVYAIGLRLLRDSHEAEQVLVDVFAELWDRPDRFDASRGSLGGFLAVLARSRSLDAARVRSRHARQTDEAARLSPEPEAGLAADAPALRDEERAAVAGALRWLSPDQRDAVRLSFYEGLTHAEIAARLGRPLGTVKTQVRQGLLRMRDALRDYWEGGRVRP